MSQKVRVFSKKMGRQIEVDIDPSQAAIHMSQKTGAGTRMLVAPEPVPLAEVSPVDAQLSLRSDVF